jgi:hypothetical protein
VMPHDYKRALAEQADEEAAIEETSSGGEGFMATERVA